MAYVQVNREELFYAENHSPGARLTMVLVHGAGESHLIWPAQMRRVEGATVYALDLPCHGKSGGRGRASVAEYVEVVRGFLDARKIERAVIAGHSMGGAIAQLFALTYPARTAGLLLVATGAKLRVAPQILEGILENTEAVLDFISQYAWGPNAPAELVKLGRAQMASVFSGIIANDYVACNTFDVIGRVGQITAPTLVIGGTADQMTPPRYATFLAEKIPGARLALIEGAGHMVMLEQSEQVARHVHEFLASIT
jgi:pimeloyl-ACP methyl ester carboxylesterase